MCKDIFNDYNYYSRNVIDDFVKENNSPPLRMGKCFKYKN